MNSTSEPTLNTRLLAIFEAGITASKLKVNEQMSDETTCFDMTINVDGEPIGTIENRGCGGPDEVHLNEASAGYKKLIEWIEARKESWAEHFEDMKLEYDLESLAQDLLVVKEMKAHLNAELRSGVCIYNGKDFIKLKAKPMKKSERAWWDHAERTIKHKHGAQTEVVNLLPPETALTRYVTCVEIR